MAILVVSLPACAANCVCGEVWRAALDQERMAWGVERARLVHARSAAESELAELRKQLHAYADRGRLSHDGVGAQSPAPEANPGSGSALHWHLPSRTLLQTDPQCQCFFWGGSSFYDGTTQTARRHSTPPWGGRFAPIKSSNYGGRPLTGPSPEDLSEAGLAELSG